MPVLKTVGPVGDPENMQMELVKEPVTYNVPEGYALLAGVQLPAVVTEEDVAAQ